MSIRYSLMDYDAVKDDYGKKTEYDIQRRTEVELGLKASKEWPLDEGNAEIYVKGAAIQSSYNGDNLKIGEIENIEATEDGTYGVGEIGVSANTDSGLSFSASASQTFGSDYNDTSFNINLAVSL